jgi:hypothetical protein
MSLRGGWWLSGRIFSPSFETQPDETIPLTRIASTPQSKGGTNDIVLSRQIIAVAALMFNQLPIFDDKQSLDSAVQEITEW